MDFINIFDWLTLLASNTLYAAWDSFQSWNINTRQYMFPCPPHLPAPACCRPPRCCRPSPLTASAWSGWRTARARGLPSAPAGPAGTSGSYPPAPSGNPSVCWFRPVLRENYLNHHLVRCGSSFIAPLIPAVLLILHIHIWHLHLSVVNMVFMVLIFFVLLLFNVICINIFGIWVYCQFSIIFCT